MTDNFEQILRENAVYGDKSFQISSVDKIFKDYELKQIGMGMMSRVYRIMNTDWVLKEGRWDLYVDLFGPAKIPVPIEFTEKVTNGIFSLSFLPKKPEILRQLNMYTTFSKYFGFFDNEEDYYHPNREKLLNQQKKIRNSLHEYIPAIQKRYIIKINKKISKVFESSRIYHNFLPQEYLLVGKSISPENKNKQTYFICQKFIKGKLLHDVKYQELPKDDLYEMILLIYLILVMESEEHILPDTRPRYPFEIYNWLTKTDNIIKSDNGLKYIDTRWFWDSKGNIATRGFMLPDFIKALAKFYINYLLGFID